MSRKEFYTLSSRDTNPNLPGVYLQKPAIVSILASDKGHEMRLLDRMKYFRFPQRSRFPLDLNEGFERYTTRNMDAFYNQGNNKIAHYIMHKDELNLANDEEVDELLPYDIITSRGFLLNLMTAPYVHRAENRKFVVTRFKNKLFIDIISTANEYKDVKFTYHFKLLQYCFSDDPKEEPNTNEPIDENDQLYCIYKSKLKNLRILYSGEMNGLISDEKLPDLNDLNDINQKKFVLTKIGKMNSAVRKFNFWCKAYLSGVNDVYIACCNNSGLVYELEHEVVSDLPNGSFWNPKVCTTFMHKFLTLVIEEMKDIDCPYTTYIFSKDPGNKTIYFDIHKGKTEYSFLTEDFIEYLKK